MKLALALIPYALLGCGKATDDTVRARSFEVVDSKGRIVARLAAESVPPAANRVYEDAVWLKMFDPTGREKIGLGMTEFGSLLQIDGPEDRDRIMVTLGNGNRILFYQGESKIILDCAEGSIAVASGQGNEMRAIQLSVSGEPKVKVMRNGKWQDAPLPGN
ncbi:MAG: hypothetical protein ACR2HJ_09320 [Fimbriimonadales bacterium]